MESNQPIVASINENAARHLYRSAQWSIFFAVLGFIGAGILLIISIGMLVGGSLLASHPAFARMPFPIAIFGVIYLPISALYFWISALMLGFANKAKLGLKTNDDQLIEQSFRKMNKFLAVMGITTIMIIALYFVLLIGLAIGGITGLLG